MPELPEVETIRRQLDPLLTGASIAGVDSHVSDKFSPALDSAGATFTGVGRRGKYLLFSLDDGRELVAHLGMTGSFSVVDAPGNREPNCADHGPHTRAVWALDDSRFLVAA